MIIEGIKLAIIGVLFVYTFLFFLVLVMLISARSLRRYTQKEEREQMVLKKRASTSIFLRDDRLVAAVSAAIAAHRKSVQR
jgi:sodium pump decarboxylase gamma subunit